MQRVTTGWTPEVGATGQERGGKQAEMQLRMGAQTRDRLGQARMDMGTRSTVLSRGSRPYTGGAHTVLSADPGWRRRSRCPGCAVGPRPPTAVYRRLWWQR